MAHPLNRPLLDPHTRSVVGGYAILQPRLGATISDANRTPFSRILAGDAGIDPYTRQSSNVYHDLFAQGSYIGKGIYDVLAFETILKGRFPENRVLSHDLIEGCFASCGFVGDVQLFEAVPTGFLADMSRRHRWIRGDWQIASWLLPKIPAAHDKADNPLSGLSRWKIVDNLRLSLTPLIQLSFLLAGCVLAPALALWWIIFTLATISGLPLMNSLTGFFHRPEGKPFALHMKDQCRLCLRILFAETFSWCCLPYTAFCYTDAVVTAQSSGSVFREEKCSNGSPPAKPNAAASEAFGATIESCGPARRLPCRQRFFWPPRVPRA